MGQGGEMTTRIRLRVSPSELAALDRAANSAGMSREAYLLARVVDEATAAPSWPEQQPRRVGIEATWEAADVALIDQAAEAHGLTRSEYVRARLWPRPAPPRQGRRPAARLVQRIETVREVAHRDQVVELAILAELDVAPGGLAAAVLAERLGRSEAEVVRSLGDLLSEGLVVLDGAVYRSP